MWQKTITAIISTTLATAPLVVLSKPVETTGSHTLKIDKVIPTNIETLREPDTDKKHYKTLEGTHYSYRCAEQYAHKGNNAAVELCEIDPVSIRIFSWPETEVINLVSGEVLIIEENGNQKSYLPGDVFVLPEGFRGIWINKEKIVKIAVRHPLYWK